ncbi:MAG: glycosyltransferase family 2 protein, partial [Chlamydiales bacterium]
MRKKLIKSAFFLLILCVASFGTWKGYVSYKSHKKEKSVKTLPIVEKPFAIVIPSYNNAAFYEKNLRSVFEQKYKNWRIIFIDDCSSDETFALVKDLVEKSHETARVTLIRNPKNRGSLANYYHAIHTCKDEEIVVALDGDDFLAHDGVLAKLNRTYANTNVWMTYGSSLDYPTYKQSVHSKKITDSVLRKNGFRKEPWTSVHLRTFYAGLFKKIQLQDLLYEGKFYPMTGDLAMMYPLFEMAGKHAQFIPDVLYLYNRTNPLNDHKINLALQQACERKIRKSIRCLPLENLANKEKSEKTDLIIFSYNRPLQLYGLLESIQMWMTGIEKISVLYRAQGGDFARGYEELQASFPNVHFFRQSDFPQKDFQPLLFE